MGQMVNVIKEINNRLSTAIGSGKELYNLVNAVYVGARDRVEMPADLPIIVIRFMSADETYLNQAMNASQKEINMKIDIELISNKEQSSGTYYTVGSSTTGFLVALENTVDVIEKTTAGVLDLSLGGALFRPMQVTYDIIDLDDRIQGTIHLDCTTRTTIATRA